MGDPVGRPSCVTAVQAQRPMSSPPSDRSMEDGDGEPSSKYRQPKWRFMTDSEITSFLRANGCSIGILRDHLSEAGLYTTHYYRGKQQKSFRAECGLNGARLRIGYIRLWASAFVATQQPDFDWNEYVGDVLNLPSHQIEGWPDLVRGMYETLEELNLRNILSGCRQKWTERIGLAPPQTKAEPPGDAAETPARPRKVSSSKLVKSLMTDTERMDNDQPAEDEAATAAVVASEGDDSVVDANVADANEAQEGGNEAVPDADEAVPEAEEAEPDAEEAMAEAVATDETAPAPEEEPELVQRGRRMGKRPEGRPTRHPVMKLFLDDIVMGLGMMRSEVEKRYVNEVGVQEISLNQKIRLLHNKITHRMATHRGYIRTANLFLLWLNEEDPELWADSGILLATQHNIYGFLEDYRMGKIRPTGMEPSIAQVLNGSAQFHKKTSQLPLSSANGAKLISSLSFMYDAQQTLLNAARVESLRSYRTFNLWETNLQYSESDRRNGTYDDRQRNVLATECPLSAKKRQSVHLVLEDSWLSNRNRALSLCQAFSVSRFDELSKWSIADLHAFNYSSNLPTVGEQDINVIYVTQPMHKNLKDGRPPDEKLLIRHKDVLLCPLSAVASMMFERYVLSNERPFDLTNFQSWYNVKVFRNTLDADKAVKSSTLYSQRKEMMENTSTMTSGCVNHYDRKIGALIARLHGIGNSELKSLGLWDSAILDRHYSKYALPDTVAKLSGFRDGMRYYLPRAKADPMEFQEIHGGEAMFSTLFPYLDDSSVFQSVLEQRSEGNNTSFNVYQTLHLLRLIFWQDLPHYFALYPQLRVFKCAALTDHWGIFLKWCDFCSERAAISETKIGPLAPAVDDEPEVAGEDWMSWRQSVDASVRDLRSLTRANAAKLDRLLHAVERHGAYGGAKRKRALGDGKTGLKECLTEGGRHILRKLRDLNDMTIKDVYDEWNVSVVSEGIEFCCLKEFERRRTELKEQYRSDQLKTAIFRRKNLNAFVEQTATELGNLERAFKWIEDLQTKLGHGRKCTLYKLWQHINAF